MSRTRVAADPARWAPHPRGATARVRWEEPGGTAGAPAAEGAPGGRPHAAERPPLDSSLAVARRGTQREHAHASSLLARLRRRRHTTGSSTLSDATASTSTDPHDPATPPGRHRGPASPESPDPEAPPTPGRHRRPPEA